MVKDKISRVEDIATELASLVDSMSMIRFVMDSDGDVEPRAVIDSIYAAEKHIERIADELDRIAMALKKGGAA